MEKTPMNLLDRIRSSTARKAAPRPEPGRLRAPASMERAQIQTADRTPGQIDLFTKLTWVQIAVGITSQTAAAAQRHVYRGENAQATHPLLTLLDRPNEYVTGFEFMEATLSWRRVTGTCYWWLNTPDEMTPPSELFIVPTGQIEPIPDGNLGVAGYRYDPGDGKPIPLAPWEIVQFKTWNPHSRYVGLSPLQAANVDARADLASQAYNANFYAHDNAKAAGILAFADNIENGAWDRMQQDIAEQHGGTRHKRLMLLRNAGPGGVEWLQTQLSQADMQYLEARRFTKEELYELFAPGLSSVLAVNATEANSTAGKDTFLSMAVYPQHIAVAETITSKLLPRYGDGLRFAFEDVRRVDTQIELLEQAAYERTHTIDEVRAKYYGDRPIGDERGVLLASDRKSDAPPPPPMLPPDAVQQAGKALDLRRWQTKAIKALVAGRACDVAFDPDYLSDDEAMTIRAGLKRARTADDLMALFRRGEEEA
jgi:HK97 family phage portal protein